MKRQNGRKHQSLERSPWLLLIPCLLLLGAQSAGFLSSADWRIQDYHYQRGGLVSPDIYVVGIDEETMMEYGSWQNWSREGTADLLRVLNQDPDTAPGVIGLDIGFFGESGGGGGGGFGGGAPPSGEIV